MNIYEIAKQMTKKEFLNNDVLVSKNGCPYQCGLSEVRDFCKDTCFKNTCRECWEFVIDKFDIEFKREKEYNKKTAQKNLIKALEDYSNLCKDNVIYCGSCVFCQDGDCMLKLGDNFLPYEESFGGVLKVAKDKLENLDKVNIYGVEHAQGGKLYDFISDEELSIGDFVVCDTCMGKSYGVVKKIEKGVNNNHKKCKKLR